MKIFIGDKEIEIETEMRIEINGGDQEFVMYARRSELVIQKIETDQPNRKTRERILIHPEAFEKVSIS